MGCVGFALAMAAAMLTKNYYQVWTLHPRHQDHEIDPKPWTHNLEKDYGRNYKSKQKWYEKKGEFYYVSQERLQLVKGTAIV